MRSSGSILNTMFTVKRAKFQHGEVLTMQVGKVEIYVGVVIWTGFTGLVG